MEIARFLFSPQRQWGWRTKQYDKRWFQLSCCELSCSNIQATPAYRVYISQFIRYSTACDSYHDFLDRGLLLTMKLLNTSVPSVYFESIISIVLRLTVVMNWLTNVTIAEKLCHVWSQIGSICRNHNPALS